MSEREQLILDLQRIRENNYLLKAGEKASQYVEPMLQYIGDTDPELRDDLICETFNEWICVKEYFSADELRYILDILLDENHLFYHLGNDGDESVFTRTFSILAVVLVLIQHRKKPVLDQNKFIDVKNSIIKYYETEKDLRGYIEKYGWAHGAAHGSDALDQLVQCRECDEAILQEILDSIKKVLYNENYILYEEEDERMARVVYRIIKLNAASPGLLQIWINSLSQCCDWDKTRKQYIARVNSKNFVRSLYFELIHNHAAADIVSALLDTEVKLNRFIQIDRNK
jgi:hypothetical protein